MTVRWPEALPPVDLAIDFVPRAIGGPPTLTGNQQWVQSDAGYWSITYANIPIYTDAQVKAWRALAMVLNGPATPILIPAYSCRTAPWPLSGGIPVTGYYSTHSDTSPFSDTSRYFQTAINVETAAYAASRSIVLSFAWMSGSPPEPGMLFSIGDWLYCIKTVTAITGGYSVEFLPPLREAVASGTAINFDSAACRCTLSDGAGLPLTLSLRRFSHPGVTFVEDYPP